MKEDNIVINQLDRVINKILFLKKKNLFQFEGIEVYPSEIHLILVIKDENSTNATKIAGQLGVTKGAVSQTLTRLEKKGILIKTKDPYNKNELTITFTSFGLRVIEYYSKYAAKLAKKHENYLKQFSDEEKIVIKRFLAEVEKVFEDD